MEAVVAEANGQQAQGEATLDGQPVGVAQDNVTPISQAKKPNKIELKKQQIFIDRLKRKMGEKTKDGKTKTQQQALAEIAQEDYQALPADKKIQRLEGMVGSLSRQMAQDIMNLRRNDASIADAFDINYRGISKMMRHLGISEEQEKAFMKEATEEAIAARQKRIEEEAAAAAAKMAAAAEADEKARMEAEAAKNKNGAVAPAEEPKKEADPHVTDGATVFGGSQG